MKAQVLLTSVLCAGASASFFPTSIFSRQSSNWTIGQTVSTTSGRVQGHAAYQDRAVSEYLGIPFAQPPVGSRRWEVPVKYVNPGNVVHNGTRYGYSCPASFSQFGGGDISHAGSVNLAPSAGPILYSLAQFGDQFSEDCLTVNVWTKPQVGESKKAVLVWIYGGGFSSGNSDNPAYDGSHVVEQEDVIVVSFNYRLNVFGFPGSRNATQNLGLLDQRLAIEWVRDNIANFGGDVSRITLFGQSAGGQSVDFYTYAWTQDPIVAGLIPQSGTATGLPVQAPLAASNAFTNLSSTLGCRGTDDAAILTCMKGKDYNAILFTIAAMKSPIMGVALFGPTVDEKLVFSDYPSRSRTGNFIKKPMLIGNADYEAGLFQTLYALGGTTNSPSYWQSFNDLIFNCPATARANISVSNGVPTWRYRWFGSFPSTTLTLSPYSGAWHASELPVFFDTVPQGGNLPNKTQAQLDIGKYFRGAWAAFAKNPVSGLNTYGWPQYSADNSTQSLVRLAYNNLTGTNVAPSRMYDAGCAAIYPVSASGSGTGGGAVSGGSSSTGTAAVSSGTAAASSGTAAGGSSRPATTTAAGATSTGASSTRAASSTAASGSAASSGRASTTSAAAGSATSISPAAAASIAADTAKLPSCSLSCLINAISSAGCAVTDYLCQCTTGKAAITASATPCILAACSVADGTLVQTITNDICLLAVPAGSGGTSTTVTGVSATTGNTGFTNGPFVNRAKKIEGSVPLALAMGGAMWLI